MLPSNPLRSTFGSVYLDVELEAAGRANLIMNVGKRSRTAAEIFSVRDAFKIRADRKRAAPAEDFDHDALDRAAGVILAHFFGRVYAGDDLDLVLAPRAEPDAALIG